MHPQQMEQSSVAIVSLYRFAVPAGSEFQIQAATHPNVHTRIGGNATQRSRCLSVETNSRVVQSMPVF